MLQEQGTETKNGQGTQEPKPGSEPHKLGCVLTGNYGKYNRLYA